MLRFLPALARFAPSSSAESISAEREWILRAQEEDGRAFRILFERHAPSVHRFLRDLLGDAAAADEATQETFVRAYRRLRSLRAEDRFRPWILGIARNVFREQCRRKSRHVSLSALDAAGSEPEVNAASTTALEAGLELDASTPESLLLVREATTHLERALQRLTEDRRAVLLLRFDHGLSCAEASALLGWSVAKVKVEVHRARLQLRAELTALEEGGR